MKSLKVFICGLCSTLLTICTAHAQVSKPDIFVFGENLETLKKELTGISDSLSVRLNEEIQLPTVQNSQSQLNVYGFMFEGKKRNVELVFADDQMDIVWILTDAEEEKEFIDDFISQFGEPSHRLQTITFFVNHGVAVRNEPHEVLFISERLKAPYKQWLDSQQ